MNEIKTKGSSTIEFATDVMTINYAVKAFGNSTAGAMKNGKTTVEKLLHDMTELGVDISEIQFGDEQTRTNYNKENLIEYHKEITYKTTADLAVLERLTSIISPNSNITYNVDFTFKDEDALANQVIEKAIDDSRKKAEVIAAKLGKNIIDAKSVNFEVYESTSASANMLRGIAAKAANPPLETMIALKKKAITKSIDIIWITD